MDTHAAEPLRSQRRLFRALAILAGVALVAGGGGYLIITVAGGDHAIEEPPVPGFKDIAPESGITFRMCFLPEEQGGKFKINLYDHGCGVAVADYDGDGYEDIYFVNQLGANALFKNQGDGTFVDVTRDAGVGLGDRICVGAAFGDYDNDGRPDLFVTSTRGGNVLFRNLGNGKFQDVTRAAGLSLAAHCQGACFFDYDNDGLLDLFVTCSAQWTTQALDQRRHYYAGLSTLEELMASPKEFNVLYRNNGDGTFTVATEPSGLRGKGWGGDIALFDYDDDGRLDVLVTNMFGSSQLYRNNGNGTFADVTRAALGRTSWGAIGCKAFDFNNDGRLDLLIADMHSDMWIPLNMTESAKRSLVKYLAGKEKARYPFMKGPAEWSMLDETKFASLCQIKYDQVIFGNTLFSNEGHGKLKEVGLEAGIETFWPWGIATGDFNNDGYEDVFLPSGMGFPWFYWPNRLLLNNGNGTFAERSAPEGIEPPREGVYLAGEIAGRKAARSSRCAAVADFRKIGRLDIVTNNFNDRPYYFQNQFPVKNYICFRLRGTKSNRDAVGALVRIYCGEEIITRQVHGAGGYLSQSSQVLHFGLGDRAHVDRAEIRWPSGARQTLQKPALNQYHEVVEPSVK